VGLSDAGWTVDDVPFGHWYHVPAGRRARRVISGSLRALPAITPEPPAPIVDGAHFSLVSTATVWPPDGLDQRSRRRRRQLRIATTVAVGTLITSSAALGVLLADGGPTNWPPVDAIYRGGFAALCAVAGVHARRWSLLWACAIVTAAGGPPVQLVSALATLAVMGMLVFRMHNRVLGAALGAVAALGALTLERPTGPGATAAVAAVAVAPLLITAYASASGATRRNVHRCIALAFAAALAGIAGVLWFGLEHRSTVDSAVEQSRSAVALTADSPQDAGAAFEAASASFRSVGVAADEWWMVPARIVPVLGANVEAVRAATATGVDLNRTAADVATIADADGLRSPQGGLDLAVLRSLRPEVSTAATQLESSIAAVNAARSPWLVGPVRSGIAELVDELERAHETSRTAELAVDLMPGILGSDGPRRYLMLLGNPAESRDLGGHIGNWAELSAVDGRIDLVAIGGPYDLASPATSPPLRLTPGAYPQSMVEMRPQNFPQNWGASADFPTVSRLARELYEQVRPGPALDGVLYADPAAFAALLSFTGPETVAGTDIVLTPDNAEAFLTTGQYEVFAQESEGNVVVTDLIQNVVQRFGRSQLPRLPNLIDTLGPLVRRGSIQFVSFDGEENDLLERLGLTGEVERPGSGDLLAVLTRNANPSKIDVYLERQTEYTVEWDPETGDVTAQVRVTLDNQVPDGPLPDVVANPIPGLEAGTNRLTLSILSPWSVVGATLSGAPVNVGTQQELRGVRRHSIVVDLPPGERRVADIQLKGNVGAGVPYLLRWVGQPTADDSPVSVTVVGSGGDDDAFSRRTNGAEDALWQLSPGR
jgi:hypothetical protein